MKSPMKPLDRIITFFVLIVFVIALVWIFWLVFFDGATKPVLDQKTPGTAETAPFDAQDLGAERPIQITDGVMHSVPLDELVGGGPEKDGIPSIDQPSFVSVTEAQEFLSDNDPGMTIDIDGVQRFYPYQILVWHEIVNDQINGKRILVSYCPLCFSGVVYDPLVDGEPVEFGVSGKLWQSNLVMYDRKTDSLWSQILGEAIVGESTGQKLPVLPSDLAKFGDWKKQNPSGQVLSRDTGVERTYGVDPYGDYYSNQEIYFPVAESDDRLDPKEFVVGIWIDGQAKAFVIKDVERLGEISDTVGGRDFVLKYERDIEAVRVYEKLADGTLERFNALSSYWFAWIAAYPQSDLYSDK